MKNLSLHTPSILLGLGIAALLGVAMSQVPVSGPALDVRVIEPATVHTPAHPRDFVHVPAGSPYTVPPNRVLAITGGREAALGNLNPSSDQRGVVVHFDGQAVLAAEGRWYKESNNGMAGGNGDLDIPPGLAAPAGTVVSTNSGVILGYLADA